MNRIILVIACALLLPACDPRHFGTRKLLNIELQDLRSSTERFCLRENRPPKPDEIHFGSSPPLQDNYWLISDYEGGETTRYVVMVIDRYTHEMKIIYRGDSGVKE